MKQDWPENYLNSKTVTQNMEYYVLIINIGLKKTLKIHFSIPFWSFTHKMKMSREMEHALYGGTVLKA